MTSTRLKILWLLALLVGLSACATQRPVLSPNEHLNRVNPEKAERDIDDCIQRAENSASSIEREANAAERVAKSTGTSATIGAAAGGAGGAVVGAAGTGAAVGAVGGGVAALMRGLLRELFASREPSPAYKGFVNYCLREKGYEPIGWK